MYDRLKLRQGNPNPSLIRVAILPAYTLIVMGVLLAFTRSRSLVFRSTADGLPRVIHSWIPAPSIVLPFDRA